MSFRTWFITGSSTGFGRQLTELLLDRGERVAATARRPESLADLAGKYGDTLWTAALDVTDAAAVRRVVTEAFTTLGRIDVVVSNAGYGLFGAAEELTDEQITRQVGTNLVGSIQLARAAIPFLRTQGGGELVQLSSMGGHIGFPGLSLYHATKWGIEGFYEALAAEIAPFGIGVTLVEPGGARTDFGGRSMDHAPALAEYEKNPVGGFRTALQGGSGATAVGDPAKIVQAIVDALDTPVDPAGAGRSGPRRLLLGSDAYRLVTAALKARLQDVTTQREVAYSTDADDAIAARTAGASA